MTLGPVREMGIGVVVMMMCRRGKEDAYEHIHTVLIAMYYSGM